MSLPSLPPGALRYQRIFKPDGVCREGAKTAALEALLATPAILSELSPAELLRLDRRVLGLAIADVRDWGSLYSGPIHVNVNWPNFGDPGYASWVLGTLRDAELPPRRLVFEPLETGRPGWRHRAVKHNVRELVAAGVVIVPDDIGDGCYYHPAQLEALLRRQPQLDGTPVIGMIKLSGDLVGQLHGPAVAAFIATALKYGVRTIVFEHVESKAQLAAALALGAAYGIEVLVQGHYYWNGAKEPSEVVRLLMEAAQLAPPAAQPVPIS